VTEPQRERLGRLAYEAYCDSRGWRSILGEDLPSWYDQADAIREAWQAAAENVWRAAVAELTPDPME
jgi:hypothetical protein